MKAAGDSCFVCDVSGMRPTTVGQGFVSGKEEEWSGTWVEHLKEQVEEVE